MTRARAKTKKPATFAAGFLVFEIQVGTAHPTLPRGDLVAVELKAQLLRLARLEGIRLFPGQCAAAAIELDANGIVIPTLTAVQTGRAEDARLTAGLGGVAGQIDLGVGRHMQR